MSVPLNIGEVQLFKRIYASRGGGRGGGAEERGGRGRRGEGIVGKDHQHFKAKISGKKNIDLAHSIYCWIHVDLLVLEV